MTKNSLLFSICLFAASSVSAGSVEMGRIDYESLVKNSDDYARYSSAFVGATRDLIDKRRCKPADFKEMGGWLKSTTTYKNQPVYFTYCGGMTVKNRIYLDASSGRIFK